MPADPLAQLRHIHLPEPVSWWPPSPAWWLLALLLLVLAAAAVFWIRHIRRNGAGRRAALQALRALDAEADSLGPREYLQSAMAILKRAAISQFGRGQVAALSGAAWAEFLNQKKPAAALPDDVLRLLTHDAYAGGTPEFDRDQLQQALQRWLRTAVGPDA